MRLCGEGNWVPHLGGCVVFWLGIAHHQRIVFVGIDELDIGAQDYAGRAGVYECLHSRLLRRLDEVLCPSNIDLLLDRRREVEVWRRSVDDTIRLQFPEQALQTLVIGDVAIVVGNIGA